MGQIQIKLSETYDINLYASS